MSYRITQQHNYTAVDVWNGSRWVASFASEADAKAFIATQDLLSACQAAQSLLKCVPGDEISGVYRQLCEAIAKATKGAGCEVRRR